MAFNDLIKKTGKSLREIEKETGLSYSLLSRLLNNKVSPSFSTIHKLATRYKWSNAEIGKAIMESDSYRIKEYAKPDKVVSKNKKKGDK